MIITTRRHADAPADYHDLEPLPRAESLDLLCAWAGPYAVDGDGGLAAANEMVRLLGGLPLALFLAGRYLAQRRQQACEFVEWLEQSDWQTLPLWRPAEQEHSAADAAQPGPGERSGQAAFAVVGVLAVAPFASEVWPSAWKSTVAAAHRALGELVNYGLLLRPDDSYQVTHALAHGYRRRRPRQKPRRSSGWRSTMLRWPRSRVAADRRGSPCSTATARILWRCRRRHSRRGSGRQCAESRGRSRTTRFEGLCIDRVIVFQAGLDAARRPATAMTRAFLKRTGSGALLAGRAPPRRRPVIEALVITREIGDRAGEGNALGNMGLAYATWARRAAPSSSTRRGWRLPVRLATAAARGSAG